MGDVPTVDTSTWRLPKTGHKTPEASYTDDMYRAKGLPVDPDRVPTTGGSGLPTVNTEEWVLPSTRARLEETRGVKPGDVIVDDQGREYEILAKLGEAKPPRRPRQAPKRSLLERKHPVGERGTRTDPGEQVEPVQTVQRRLAGLERSKHLEFATGKPYRQMPGESRAVPIQEAAPPPQKRPKSRLPKDQQALAGLTERAPLPHPMGDTRPVGTGRSHGILDDGMDDGEAFVEQVLAESRWFFRDFGDLALGAKKRPFDEAPGGRSGPWRGSDDEPAETPIVRKGKVKGAVGDEPEEEPEPEGKKQVPPTKRSKAKAPPEEEPEGDEEQEEQVESEGRPGSFLKRGGSRLKALGHKMSHGSAAQRAKEGLKKHLHKFVKKHGIKAMGHEPEKKKKPEAKIPDAPSRHKVDPGTFFGGSKHPAPKKPAKRKPKK